MTLKITNQLKDELASLYAALAIEQRQLVAICHQCGACCNFKTYGHELWVTNLELTYLVENEGIGSVSDTGVCPYMENNRCTARIGRTLGCRVFLCEQDAVEMEKLHEKYFNSMRELAQTHNVELEYREFIDSLRQLKKEK